MTNNNSSNQNNGPRPLEKSVKVLALTNIALGIFVMILQFAVDLTYIFDLADWVSTGFWGGICFISTGGMVMKRRSGGIAMMAIFSLLSGLAMLGVYIWNIATVTQWGICYYYYSSCDWRYVADVLFIVAAVIAILVNAILAKKAKTIQPVYPVYPATNTVIQMQSYPITTTTGNVTYVNGQALYPVQTVGGPYYGQQQVVTSTNTFVYPNQPQPVYYPTNQQQQQAPPQAGFVDSPPAYAYGNQPDPSKQTF